MHLSLVLVLLLVGVVSVYSTLRVKRGSAVHGYDLQSMNVHWRVILECCAVTPACWGECCCMGGSSCWGECCMGGSTVVAGVSAAWVGLVAGVSAAWVGLVAGVSAAWVGLVAGVSAAWVGLVAGVSAAWVGLVAGVSAAWVGLVAGVSAAWVSLVAGVSAAWVGLVVDTHVMYCIVIRKVLNLCRNTYVNVSVISWYNVDYGYYSMYICYVST